MGEVSAYVESLAEPERSAVERVYARARAVVPEATEGLGYGMPALVHGGKPLIAVKVAAAHIGLYPFSPDALDTVRADLTGFSLSKGTLRFTAATPVPDDVLDRLVAARRAEIEA
jgi:uncharacterized protein YdhG (YjbR/CyaY superfamily)